MNAWQAAVAAVCVITGTIYDSQHHPAPAVKVYLQSADKKELTAQTDSVGVYRFLVPSGTYTVRAEGGTARIKAEPNRTTTADLTAQPAFFDEPKYTAAGVTDYTYRGGHGSDSVFRSAQTMAKALEKENASVGDTKEASLYERGTELLNHREAREAAEVFRNGIELFPQSVRMLLGMASTCYAEGAYDESARWFYRATDLVSNDPKPYLFLGRVQARQITESSGYKERMARFAKLQPDNALANYYYGTTLSDERARDSFQKAVRLDPHLAVAHVRLGALAAREGNYDEAIRDYQAAIAADPELEEAHYRLSEAYRLTGDSAKAKEELAIFRRLSKESAARE